MHIFKKRFGQNFLKNQTHAIKMVDSLDLKPDDTVVEIGPGHGAVTEHLIGKVKRLLVVEIDNDLIPFLQTKFGKYPYFEIAHIDILKFNPEDYDLKAGGYKLIGSLPYNISKKIIYTFLTTKIKPEIMSFIVQKEVAENYTSKPPRADFLSNFAQIYSDPSYIGTIDAKEFHPTPKVDGGILKFEFTKKLFPKYHELNKFIKTGYSSPRKKLSSNLSHGLKLDKNKVEKTFEKLNINLNSRPSELTIDAWESLFKELDV